MRYIDLHLHSTNSDGTQSPDELVKAAKEEGLSLIAVTDHNLFTFTNPWEYDGMTILPGIELSTEYSVPSWEEKTEIHIVGLFPHGVDAANFDAILSGIGEGKEAYVAAILQDMEKRGIYVAMSEVLLAAGERGRVGRHEIARVLVEKGIETDVDAAFDHQIGNFSPYYIPSTKYIRYVSMEGAVRCIMENGGIPILAHPYGYSMSEEEIEQLVADFQKAAAGCSRSPGGYGGENLPAGMEVYYQLYLEEETTRKVDFLKELQHKYRLLASAGSDRHRPDQSFCTEGDYHLYEKMKEALSTAAPRPGGSVSFRVADARWASSGNDRS